MEEHTNFAANTSATNVPLPSYCHMPAIFSLQFPFTVSNICCHLFARKGISELTPLCMMKWQTERSQRQHHQQLFTLLFSLNFLFSKVYSSCQEGCVIIKISLTHTLEYGSTAIPCSRKWFSLPPSCIPPLQKAYLYSLEPDKHR